MTENLPRPSKDWSPPPRPQPEAAAYIEVVLVAFLFLPKRVSFIVRGEQRRFYDGRRRHSLQPVEPL